MAEARQYESAGKLGTCQQQTVLKAHGGGKARRPAAGKEKEKVKRSQLTNEQHMQRREGTAIVTNPRDVYTIDNNSVFNWSDLGAYSAMNTTREIHKLFDSELQDQKSKCK